MRILTRAIVFGLATQAIPAGASAQQVERGDQFRIFRRRKPVVRR